MITAFCSTSVCVCVHESEKQKAQIKLQIKSVNIDLRLNATERYLKNDFYIYNITNSRNTGSRVHFGL